MKIKLPYLASYRSGGKTVLSTSAGRGIPNVRLDGAPGTAEFMASYQAALASAPVRSPKHGPGTFGSLVLDFYNSVEFANLKPSSQRMYRRVLDSVAEEHGHRPAATLPAEFASKMIEQIGRDRPGLANLTRDVMHRLDEVCYPAANSQRQSFRGRALLQTAPASHLD